MELSKGFEICGKKCELFHLFWCEMGQAKLIPHGSVIPLEGVVEDGASTVVGEPVTWESDVHL